MIVLSKLLIGYVNELVMVHSRKDKAAQTTSSVSYLDRDDKKGVTYRLYLLALQPDSLVAVIFGFATLPVLTHAHLFLTSQHEQ